MAVISVNVIGTVSATLPAGVGDRKYSVSYRVITDSRSDQAITAITAVGIPSIGESYAVGNDSDTSSFVESYSARLENIEDSEKTWVVTVNYSSHGTPDNRDHTHYEFPWLEPPIVSGSGVRRQELLTYHYPNPGVNVTSDAENSAGEAYDDLFVAVSDPSVTIEKNYRTLDLDILFEYANTVNENTFFSLLQDEARLSLPRWRKLYTGQGIPYFNVVYEFEGMIGGWNNVQRVDEGDWYLDAAGNRHRFIDPSTKMPMPGRQKLDGAGGALWPFGATVWNTFKPYRRKDFANLGIPTSI